MQLLDRFHREQKDIIEDTLQELAKEDSKDYWYASKKFELRLQQANVTTK